MKLNIYFKTNSMLSIFFLNQIQHQPALTFQGYYLNKTAFKKYLFFQLFHAVSCSDSTESEEMSSPFHSVLKSTIQILFQCSFTEIMFLSL